MPRKHIMLSMLIKSLTGSRKILTVLNKFGYGISYSKEEELETELASAFIEKGNCAPDGRVHGLVMGNAWDNYDELTRTLSGSDTLHDTMGILYQNQPLLEAIENPDPPNMTVRPSTVTAPNVTPSSSSSASSKRKMKRKLVLPPAEFPPPISKKTKMDKFDYVHTDVDLPDLTQRARRSDKVWMMGHCLGANDMPMWSGFNAGFHQDALPEQNVYYMPNLDKAPTKDNIVAETMRISKRCAEECGQTYALVTYDLDVAKKAHKILVTDQPEFDDVFIMFGVFHIQICHFRSIGKMIAQTDGSELLIESGVLASISLRRLIECYNFNRCKRLHQMFALAMEILHFRQFLSEYPEKDQVFDELKVFKFSTPMEIDTLCDSDTFRDVYRAYDEYTNRTLEGTHGPTSRFWMM